MAGSFEDFSVRYMAVSLRLSLVTSVERAEDTTFVSGMRIHC